MKTKRFLILAAVAVLSLSLLVGCTSTKDDEEANQTDTSVSDQVTTDETTDETTTDETTTDETTDATDETADVTDEATDETGDAADIAQRAGAAVLLLAHARLGEAVEGDERPLVVCGPVDEGEQGLFHEDAPPFWMMGRKKPQIPLS